ncbi:MAG: serine/threonine-protein kinase [Myxococcales bacterium]
MIQCPSCNNKNDDGAKFCPKCGSVLVRAPGSDDDDQVGKIVAGKFRIEKLIGEGGMGKVFRATQMSLDKTVVLKVLRTSLLGDARTVARFQREAKAASRLNHPNSISVIDFGQSDDGSLYIAMEYVAGEDLHQLLSREGPLPQKRICRIVGQVLSALADAHAAGVIHRDLKPENIMVEQRRGEADFVKVLDFGIAKIQENEGHGGDGQALTRAGFVCGTPEYMSPEQARGLQLDSRTDLYAVGVIIYQCATNMLPFEADSAVALATMHLTTPPPPPRQKYREAPISDGMEALILRAMEKDPALRPPTAEDFRRELLALENDFDATKVQTIPPSLQLRNSGALRKVSKNNQSGRHAAHPPVSKPSEASMPTWASSPGGAVPDDATAITGKSSPPVARRTSKGQTSTVAIFVGALLGTALLAGGGLVAYDRFVRAKETPVAVDEPTSTPPTTKPPPGDVNLVHEQPNEDLKKERARLITEGDQAIAQGLNEAALSSYLKAFDSDTPSPQLIKRVAMVYLMQGRTSDAAEWLKRYTKRKDQPDLALFESALQAASDKK